MDDIQNNVKEAFSKHGVDNPELENAISDILNQVLDSRTLSKRIWKDVIEHYERDEKVKRSFR
ncbi:hypothetical protein JNUCC1_03360 [Lentibacillus sp. JNUCC-1]|uniref:hypothetical protein n=1 Tax=Lentibacillus sp. JNUCC-1 TaxID=2654513 RepID=UPI0012E753F2|nr:hypothetical protein [Lentibacillus sp. JNUCC-1]MUV39482.1 hypothetical protein [Lentibacillus sp. JNUCC-1]